MARYRFNLIQSKDLSNIGELAEASAKTLTVKLNKPGNASFSIPMSADHASEIKKYKTGIAVWRFNQRRSITAGQDRWDLVWSGYVLGINEDWATGKMTVDAVGWLQRLEKRFLREDKNYAYVNGVSTDDGEIILDLLDHANLTLNNGYVVPVVVGSDPLTPTWMARGSKLPNEGVGGLTAYAPAWRGKNYTKYTYIASAINEMTDIENGCDIEVDPYTRELNVYRKKMRTLSNVAFHFNHVLNNLATFSVQRDGSEQINYELVTGSSGTIPQYAHIPEAMEEVGLLEEHTALSDVVNVETLQVYAGSEVLLRQDGRQIYTIGPHPYTDELDGRVPEPFVDFTYGDRMELVAHNDVDGFADVKGQYIRLFGFTVNCDTEKLTNVELAP